ncbi:MAG: hypothetical protein KF747_15410 [Nitrospira sp.]|nr:hypothetical protein [Nitrospira sp.]
MDAAEPSQKSNPRNLRHGISLMKRALKAGGTRALDRRTRVSKALDHWRDELIADLGGSEQVSTQQRAIINVAVKTKLLLDSVDAWLLQQPSLINLRKRAVHPVVLQRQQLADSLIRAMVQLGLERRAKVLPSLSEYLNGTKPKPPALPAPTPETSETDASEATP